MASSALRAGCWFVASSAGLILFCLGADHAIFRWEERWLKLSHGVSLRAVSDSVVHGLVGGRCWANVLLLTSGIKSLSWAARIGQVVLCVVMATAIDLDHLIEARSFSIKVMNHRRCFFVCVIPPPPPPPTHTQDALSLPKRPFAHNSTLIPVVTAVLYLLVYVLPPSLCDHSLVSALPLIFLVSSFSHHLRDADRRGLWFAPFLSTPPIPFKFYTLFIILLPLATAAPRLLPLAFKALVDIRALYKSSKTTDISMA